MPTITQLHYILAVNKHKHFGRAAEECNVSQPSLSAQVQKVEDELGQIIFDRSKKPVLVTDAGHKIVDQARKVIREHRKLIDFSSAEGEVQGSFHLGVIPTLAPYLIPLFVENFSMKYPKVKLTIGEYKTQDILHKLYDDEIDGGLLVTPLYDNQIIERSLFLEPFYVFVSEHHEFIDRKYIKDSELDASSVWLLEEGHCFRDQVIRVCSLKNRNRVLENINFASGNLETLVNLIRRGRGYTLLPHLATVNLKESEKKRNLKKFVAPVPTREVSLVHSRSFFKQAIIDKIEETIVAQIPKELESLKRERLQVVDI